MKSTKVINIETLTILYVEVKLAHSLCIKNIIAEHLEYFVHTKAILAKEYTSCA